MRRIISVLASIIIVSTMMSAINLEAYALQLDSPVEEIDAEEYLYTDIADNHLCFVGNTASCTSSISLLFSVDHLEIETYLERYENGKWGSVASWSVSKNNIVYYSVNYSENNLSSGMYRLKTVFKVFNGNYCEIIDRKSPSVTI